MGKGEVSLDGLEVDKEHTMWVKLTEVATGEVQLGVLLKRQKELDEDDD
jgi:sugar lactone lactonase YvrE